MGVKVLLAIGLILLISSGCESIPPKGSETLATDLGKFSYKGLPDDHMELLAVSGGGHRAAHYTIGMLLALDHIPIQSDESTDNTLLEQIDVVSSVSGGSYGVALYFSSYMEDRCNPKNENPQERALALLKNNRVRLHAMASGWFGSLFEPIVNPTFLSDDLRNIDNLEEKYYAPITDIVGCSKIPLLHSGHLSGEGPIEVPFRHIVNATNAKTGKVFSFYKNPEDKTQGGLSENHKIGCVIWRAQRFSSVYGYVPYSLALASSAAFPPLVTDGIFGKETDCTGGPYLRLTDGGQADDNGIDTALEFASKWLGVPRKGADQKKGAEPKRAFILSVDSLVESSNEFALTDVNEGLIEIAVYRNADLPRYSKKRKQKADLRKTAQITQSAEWETFAKGRALFGVSVNFARKHAPVSKEIKVSPSVNDDLHSDSKFDISTCNSIIVKTQADNELCFSRQGKRNDGSDISTFQNTNGLNFDQQVKGVAEGYFQTFRKFALANDNDKFAYRAERIAFDLYCSDEVRQEYAAKCRKYLNDNSESLVSCFTIDESNVVQRNENDECKIDSSVSKQHRTSLLVFNDIQERVLETSINKNKESSLASEVNYVERKLIEFTDRNGELDKLLEDHQDNRDALLKKVSELHFEVIGELVVLNDLGEITKTEFGNISDAISTELAEDIAYLDGAGKFIDDVSEKLEKLDTLTFELQKDQVEAICSYTSESGNLSLPKKEGKECPPKARDWLEQLAAEKFGFGLSFFGGNELKEVLTLENRKNKIDTRIGEIGDEDREGTLIFESNGAKERLLEGKETPADIASTFIELGENRDDNCDIINAIKKDTKALVGFLPMITLKSPNDVNQENTAPTVIPNSVPKKCDMEDRAEKAENTEKVLKTQSVVRTINRINEMKDDLRVDLTIYGTIIPSVENFDNKVKKIAENMKVTSSHKAIIRDHLSTLMTDIEKNPFIYDWPAVAEKQFVTLPLGKSIDKKTLLPGEGQRGDLVSGLCDLATNNRGCEISKGLANELDSFDLDKNFVATNKNDIEKLIAKFIDSYLGLKSALGSVSCIDTSITSKKTKPDCSKEKDGVRVEISDGNIIWRYDAIQYIEDQSNLQKQRPCLKEREQYSVTEYFDFRAKDTTRYNPACGKGGPGA